MGEKISSSEVGEEAFAFEIQPKIPDSSSPEGKVWQNLGLRIGDRVRFQGNSLEYELKEIKEDRKLDFIRLYFVSTTGDSHMETLQTLQADKSCFTKI